MNPAQLTETAPETFQAKFVTTKGEFIVNVTRAWAPNGADRFYNLVKNGLYDDCRFFRVVKDFMVQFGINGDPNVSKSWQTANIPTTRAKNPISADTSHSRQPAPTRGRPNCLLISATTVFWTPGLRAFRQSEHRHGNRGFHQQ